METVPHVVFEYDKWSDCALVALTDDARSAVRGGLGHATFGGAAAWPVYRGHKNQ